MELIFGTEGLKVQVMPDVQHVNVINIEGEFELMDSNVQSSIRIDG